MSAINSSDFATYQSNMTTLNQISIDDGTWFTRFQKIWDIQCCYALGAAMCSLVIGISLFDKKHITGDYKWFVLNQAIANFAYSFGLFLFSLVCNIIVGPVQFLVPYLLGSAPLWVSIFMETEVELQTKFGRYAQMTTLFATVFNRYMAIVLPDLYPKFMRPPLIILYCSLCYLLILPIDDRLFDKLSFSLELQNILISTAFILPWLMSIILSAMIYRKLLKHMRSVASTTDKRRLKETRNILYAIMIQIALPLFDKVPEYWCMLGVVVEMFSNNAYCINSNGSLFTTIWTVNDMLSPIYICLVILITMRPYREALLSLLCRLLHLTIIVERIEKMKQYFKHMRQKIGPATTDSAPIIHLPPVHT